MKRKLALKHLLYNAKVKPDYVQAWMDQINKTIKPVEDLYSPSDVPWMDFVPGDQNWIYDFNFEHNRPTYREVFDSNGLPSIGIILNIGLAKRREGVRKLDHAGSVLTYNPASGQYRLHLNRVWYREWEDCLLTTADKEALDLIVPSVMKPLVQKLEA